MGAARLAALLLVAHVSAEPDETRCSHLGFGPSLLCSSCDQLAEHVGAEDALVEECRGCCHQEVTGTGGTYPQATLDICR